MQRVKVAGAVAAVLERLQDNSAVAFVEPNYIVQHTDISNDPSYGSGSLWGMFGDDAPISGPTGTTNSFGSDAEEAWLYGATGSKRVYVGIIDEGIQVNHPDLAANIWVNPHDPVDGIDNDGNGYVDDTNGWDFLHKDRTVYDSADGDMHGTHVAGTIGGVGGNGIGVVGVNWNVSLISAKFLGPQGGSLSDAIDAINYLRDLKTRHGIKIVAMNNSWGGGFYSSALHTAILRAAKQGILFVAAAGNSGFNNDFFPAYPSNYTTLQPSAVESAAGYEAVIAVAAIDSAGRLASFSNYGPSSVDIGAPGVSILSTVGGSSYASYSGTSMATPHVSGALALYANAFPSASAQQIRSAILGNAAPTSSLNGRCATRGRLSLANLFRPSSEPPGTTPTPNPAPDVRDVAVLAVSPQNPVGKNSITSVSVQVQNQGSGTETVRPILIPSAGKVLSAPSATISAGATATLQFSWQAPSRSQSVTFLAMAPVLQGEKDFFDNLKTGSTSVQ
jgi:subtilisin family serine protease